MTLTVIVPNEGDEAALQEQAVMSIWKTSDVLDRDILCRYYGA
jgi:hypothetical protein